MKTVRPPPPAVPRAARRLRGEELIRLGVRDSEIADELGVSRACVNLWRQALGIVAVPLADPNRGEAAHLLQQGLSAAEVSARLGLSRDTVQTWRRQLGLPLPAWSPRVDLVGQRFGRLLVLAFDAEETGQTRRGGRRTHWRCRCDCGEETSKRQSDMVSGRVRSCGCLLRRTGRGALPRAGSPAHRSVPGHPGDGEGGGAFGDGTVAVE